MNFLSNISIKNKHFIILCFVICGLVLTTLASVYEFGRIASLSDILLVKEKLSVDVLSLRKHEKDFLARKDTKYGDKFASSIEHLYEDINDLKTSLNEEGLNNDQAKTLNVLSTEYSKSFQQLVKLQIEIGLDSKSGLYGSLRAAVHDIEELAKEAGEYEILFHMLMLRRNEKDFMLRRLTQTN